MLQLGIVTKSCPLERGQIPGLKQSPIVRKCHQPDRLRKVRALPDTFRQLLPRQWPEGCIGRVCFRLKPWQQDTQDAGGFIAEHSQESCHAVLGYCVGSGRIIKRLALRQQVLEE